MIAFGDPVYEQVNELRQLPYTRHEVKAIAALFPSAESRVWLGAEANELNSKATELNKFRYVHFATHALADVASSRGMAVSAMRHGRDAHATEKI